MNLSEIAKLMLDGDYRNRFRAEYYHLKVRLNNLKAVLKLWDENKLDFTPDCPRSIYTIQLRAMEEYLAVLEARARIENVNIDD
ncbi:MAG: hypothetical protein AUK63_1507 [bacterium P3]|nr:MAG: hypothetical protein AUK63_1507 [bacterium P3]KWW41097.1 MAG: hypothetical protein F083_1264 [bacterium F083]